MCGIAGLIDLSGYQRPVPTGVLVRMADAIVHRGPDEDGYLQRPGLGLASRRLSIVGLFDGRQPIGNEDGSVAVVFNGELFDYPEQKSDLEKRGHRFRTHCDTELIPHLYEDHQEQLFEHLRGQFAVAVWDERRQRLLLGRDRFGICPLFWTRQTGADGDWLLFASEIKALLASGMVPVKADLNGINQVFTFFALPGPMTCFQGVNNLLPGHYLDIQPGRPQPIRNRIFWEVDFPDEGNEEQGQDAAKLVDAFQERMLAATEKRLRADVPVVAYLSGGVDSSLVVALASHVRKEAIPTFTIRIDDPRMDETTEAGIVARHVGTEPVVLNCGASEILSAYPQLIRAAEAPVIDTSCAALLLMAGQVHAHQRKVVLTGEGADEWLAGYPWYKVHKLLGYLDFIPGLKLSQGLRRAMLWLQGRPAFPRAVVRRSQELIGGHNGWLDVYGLCSLSKLLFYGPDLMAVIQKGNAFEDLELNQQRLHRWHPLNRALYIGARIHLPGLLLAAKGDRVAMNSSVETRYPFLDEDVFDFLAPLHPRWKMKGFRDKHILRLLAERWLPRRIARRRKVMFRAPLDSFYQEPVPAFVNQLLSPESLRRTGYFDERGVQYWRRMLRNLRPGSNQRLTVEFGLVGVVSTQLWHHTFISGDLADHALVASGAASARRYQPLPAG